MRAARGRAQQLWRVFDRSLVPMATVDNNRRIVAANRAARLLARLSLAEMRQRRITDFTPPEMDELLERAWERMLRTGAVCGPFTANFQDGGQLQVVYCALANALPSQHLIVFAPALWPEDELGTVQDGTLAPLDGPLSPREREVLAWISAGAEIREIAGELTISTATVRTHLQNAHRKLGARNRPHAIAIAIQRGLIDLPGPSTDGDPSSF